MRTDPKARTVSDLFLDALNAEIISGTENLDLWLQHLDERHGIDSLFELESRLKGLCCFFDLQHLPVDSGRIPNLLDRSFSAEFRVVQNTLRRCRHLASEIIRLGQHVHVEFETFIKTQLRKDGALEYHVGRILEQPTPLDSFLRLAESLNDTLVLLDSIIHSERQDYRAYQSLGRFFQRELKSCRYVDMLLTQRFRLQYDRIDKPALSALLRKNEDDRLRRDSALAFLYFFRLLRYLSLISRDLENDRPLQPALVIFALIHGEIKTCSEFLRSRFIKRREGGHSVEKACTLIVYALKIESQRIIERELVSVLRQRDARLIFTRVDDSNGLLRNCLQSCVITFARALDRSFDPRAIFPSLAESVANSQKLLEDLWSLRRFCKEVLDQKGESAIEEILAGLLRFREDSMRHLMYRDWAEFDRFSDGLVSAETKTEVRVLLRNFIGYLETLILQVSKRSVLQKAEPLPGQ